MDLHSLQAFVEVARHGSFSAAAEALFVTQPAISKRVKALEEELATALFDRIGRKTSLTEAGRVLLPRAKQLLDEAEDMRRFASSLSDSVSGSLVMGTSHHIGLHRLPPVLKAFRAAYPAVSLDIRFMDSEQACHAVESGDLELAIVTLPSVVPVNLQVDAIWTDRLHVVAMQDHPLNTGRKIPLEELVTYPCVLPGTSTYTHSILREAIDGLGLELNVSMTTNYLETLKMLVRTGFGWSLIPHTMVDGEIAIIDTDLHLQRELGTVIHRQRTLSNAASAILESLRDHAD
ncbi:MAG: LysR family transcriptional regulator [Gammaproteobacteria bacterium]|jgi:DNA-binding transcriptional LysR family regulator